MMYRAQQVIDLAACVVVWPGVSRFRRTDGFVCLLRRRPGLRVLVSDGREVGFSRF